MWALTAPDWGQLRRGGRACHPAGLRRASVWVMEAIRSITRSPAVVREIASVDALVVRLFTEEGDSLVRLARLFVDDRTAAEDLVQEAFIRLARSAHRIRDLDAAPAYLRSIVLNLARDHNRRGLVSLRHHLPGPDPVASTEDQLVDAEGRQEVLDALRGLPLRQRDAVVLRYWGELGIEEIAATMGVSRNTVKTHLKRGLAALEDLLGGAP